MFTSTPERVQEDIPGIWQFYELIWLSLQFGRISGYFQYPVSRQIQDIQKGRIIRPDIRLTGYPVHS
jgi:hypothetical protein